MIQGFVEYVQAFRIHGWALDPSTPSEHLLIDITCAGRRLGSTRANVFRKDLRDGGVGDGDHGFVFDLLAPLSDDELQDIAAHVVTKDGVVPLSRLTYTPDVAVQDVGPSPVAFPGTASDSEQHPVFILGSARSGTSALAQAVMATGRYWGQKEGHLLDLFAHLGDTVRSFYDQKERAGAVNDATFISRVPIGFFQQGLRHLFVELIRTAAPTPFWLDKTPNHHMIQLAPHFLAMWPNAKFIFLKRRAPEFLESRRRKFPDVPFETNCREWTAAMLAWEKVSEQLHGHALEIDQLCLVNSPSTAALNVSAFLGLNFVEARNLAETLRGERPEQTGPDSGAVLRPGDLGWSSDEQALFQDICGPVMARFGYAMDENYRLPTGPHRWMTVA